MYRKKVPFYQAIMLETLGEVWKSHHRSLLDVGGRRALLRKHLRSYSPSMQCGPSIS